MHYLAGCLPYTTDGRKIGLDQRIIDSSLPDDPKSKVNACIKKVHQIWKQTIVQRSTQLIFCDLATPNKDRFNVYDDIKTKLLVEGVPEKELLLFMMLKMKSKNRSYFQRYEMGDTYFTRFHF